MVFSSLTFICLFLPVILALYYLAPNSARNLVLVVGSYVFYAWGGPVALLLIVPSVGLNFMFGRAIDNATGARRRLVAALAIGFNLLILGIFKYSDFVVANLNIVLDAAASLTIPQPKLPLPLGISFFTFHIISYLVDVYRGAVRPQRSIVAFTLYIINFPQLIAGPIIRYRQISDQLGERTVTLDDIDTGAARFTVGLAKKTLIGNPIGAVADLIFLIPAEQLTPQVAALGMLCYGLQIYFDFSGYSDMAIGLARMFGFRFPENFNYPYAAISIQDFWRRWHITLSAWFRDYVYIPLGGNRFGPWTTTRNLWAVFLLTGIWHGASWNFVVWGLWHGFFLWLERIEAVNRVLSQSPRIFQHVYALLVVFIGWVFFRAPDLTYAVEFLMHMMAVKSSSGLTPEISNYASPAIGVLILVAIVFAFPIWPRLMAMPERGAAMASGGWSVGLGRAAFVLGVMVLSLASMAAGQQNPFLYFRF